MADRPSLQGLPTVLRSLETAHSGRAPRRGAPGAPVQQRERQARVKVPGGAHVRAPAGRRHGAAAAAAARRRRRLQRVRPHLRIVCLRSALFPHTTQPRPGRRRLRSPPAAGLPRYSKVMRCGGGLPQAQPRTIAFGPRARRGARRPGPSSRVGRRPCFQTPGSSLSLSVQGEAGAKTIRSRRPDATREAHREPLGLGAQQRQQQRGARRVAAARRAPHRVAPRARRAVRGRRRRPLVVHALHRLHEVGRRCSRLPAAMARAMSGGERVRAVSHSVLAAGAPISMGASRSSAA